MRKISMLMICLALGGCGLAAKIDAREGYQEATARYRSCLETNPANPRACEGLRMAMEAQEREFNAMSSSLTPGGQTSSSISILSR